MINIDGLRNITPPTPLVEGYLYRDSLAWLGGKPGHSKTFAAIGLACCVATGTPWHDNAVRQSKVLYLIAEGASGISDRIDAWILANGSHHAQLQSLQFLPVPVQIMDQTDILAFGRILTELQPDFVILDTQARVTVGAEENSSRDMGVFVDSLEELRRHSGACILSVHHEPRNGESLRGHTALEGAAESILRVSRDGKVITLSNPKQKNAPAAADRMLSLIPIGNSAALGTTTSWDHTESESHILTVLRDLFGTSGARATELEKACGLPPTTYFRSLKSLVTKGLVTRTEAGRSVIYTLPKAEQQPEVPLLP